MLLGAVTDAELGQCPILPYLLTRAGVIQHSPKLEEREADSELTPLNGSSFVVDVNKRISSHLRIRTNGK